MVRGSTHRGLILFAFLITGALTVLLGGLPERTHPVPELPALVVSRAAAEPVIAADTLGRGETLAVVLGRQGLAPAEVARLTRALRSHVDLRRLRAGVSVAVHRTPWDSVTRVAVRVDPDREVNLFPATDGWSSEVREISVSIDTLILAGTIETTLYHSVTALPGVEMELRERIEQVMWGIYRPFQWSIDFGLDLREGDSYRAVYERHVRPDGTVREARVLAAEFVNAGRTYRAFWFEPREEYFDGEGRSMRRVFLKAPLDFRRISSRFTRRRYHPVLGRYRAHLGTDYAANPGTPVWSTANGTVTRAGWWGGYGRVVEVRHINGYRTRYAHLSGIARGVRAGVRVSQGQTIGYVGASGLANGPHLHYELRRGGQAVDARTVDLPSGEPISESRMATFRRSRDRLLSLLEAAEMDRAMFTE